MRMERTLITDLPNHIEHSVKIAGWINTRRDQGKMVFFDIRDASGTVQGVVLPKSAAFEAAKEIRSEFVVSIEGVVNKRPENNINHNVQNGDIELEIQAIQILSIAIDLPFEREAEVNLDTYLDHLPYTLRKGKAQEIFKLQATIIEAFRGSLRNQRFIEFQAPELVGTDAEGGAAAFEVKYYYDKKAYLATSPQFYKQIMVGVFERAFTTTKAFRGEKHSTTRHMSEYATLDFEMGFIEDHRDVMATLETCIRHVIAEVTKKHTDTFKLLGAELPLLPESIPIFKLQEVQEILETKLGMKALGEPDLEPEHERQICQWAKKEYNSDFVFVTHYPVSKRPFYVFEDEQNPGFTKSFDLLFRGLEITTGGQRIHDYDVLVDKIVKKGLVPENFSFYLQAFKAGMPPHGGCATGLERITARMLNLPNIKEVTLFPRDLNRIDILLSDTDDEDKNN